jgi:hypothetical protein
LNHGGEGLAPWHVLKNRMQIVQEQPLNGLVQEVRWNGIWELGEHDFFEGVAL